MYLGAPQVLSKTFGASLVHAGQNERFWFLGLPIMVTVGAVIDSRSLKNFRIHKLPDCIRVAPRYTFTRSSLEPNRGLRSSLNVILCSWFSHLLGRTTIANCFQPSIISSVNIRFRCARIFGYSSAIRFCKVFPHILFCGKQFSASSTSNTLLPNGPPVLDTIWPTPGVKFLLLVSILLGLYLPVVNRPY